MKKLVEKQLNGLTTHLECAVTGEEAAALVVLRGCRMGVVELACLCREMEEMVDGIDGKEVTMESLRALVRAGREVMGRRGVKRVSFAEAVEATLEAKRGRSPRTLQDISQTMRALMAVDEGLASRPICELRREDCVRLLQAAYAHSPSRFVKGRANLSGVFSVACQRGWCEENPVRYVPVPIVKEKTIEPLRLPEIKRLVSVAKRESFRDCLPALALMLYAGVRPEELRRLEWRDIDWEERVLYMSPRHTKTGGGRHVPLALPLLRLLREGRAKEGVICPKGWVRRWRLLRETAGFTSWVPDVLRHSYASYHVKRYQDLGQLQLAMGHRDCRLLLTRYVNLRGISRADARVFWKGV